jgi:hypothetical protein
MPLLPLRIKRDWYVYVALLMNWIRQIKHLVRQLCVVLWYYFTFIQPKRRSVSPSRFPIPEVPAVPNNSAHNEIGTHLNISGRSTVCESHTSKT